MGRLPVGKATSFDIAYRAGVSQPTVSRALRGERCVSVATRERIEEIARELNYAVDKNASSLRTQRSNTVALLLFEDPTPDDSNINPFFLAMLGSITRAAASRGLDLLISFQRMEDDWHTRYHDSHRADGLILLGYGDYKLFARRLEQLVTQGTRFVHWGSVRTETSSATIGSDNVGGGRMAGEHLLRRGRRRIAFLGRADDHSPEFEDRYHGLCKALVDAGINPDPALFTDALATEEDGFAAIMSLLSCGVQFDGVFAASDLIAIGALRALAQAGLDVPRDVAVIGFDNIPLAPLASPPLTTVMQDVGGAGEALLEALVAKIEGRVVSSRSLPTKLVLRASTWD